jgi:hypothetical protein
LDESSALEDAGNGLFYTLNDSGSEPILYTIDGHGSLISTINLEDFGVKNEDWEALAADDLYLYIGDFGNNWNRRKNLRIYRISKAQLRRGWGTASLINFTPSEQKAFPPHDRDLQYDFEGFHADSKSLVLFSKNRTEPFNGYTRIYRIPKTPGSYTIACEDSVKLYGTEMFEGWVTGADFSTDQNLTALISGPTLHFLVKDKNDQFLDVPAHLSYTQKEAVLFAANQRIIATDEKNATSPGWIYTYDYAPLINAVDSCRKQPARVLNPNFRRQESLVLSLSFIFQPNFLISVEDEQGNLVYQERYQEKYYARPLGDSYNIIQNKTLILPASNWPVGRLTVKIDHPFETIVTQINVR